MSIITLGSAGATPVPIPVPTVYVTLAYIQSLGIDPASVTAASIADSNALYGFIGSNPWATMDQMVSWANTALTPDPVNQLNAALALLIQAGLVAQIGQ